MILEKNRIILFLSILLLVLFVLLIYLKISKCENSFQDTYWRFHHVNEKIDSSSEKIRLVFSDKPVTKQEIDTLVNILDDWGWEYYISRDTIVLIRSYGDNLMIYRKSLADELYRRMKEGSKHWSY